jgi:hydrogenase expression/formation protein HypD
MVIGQQPFEAVVNQYQKPIVISGFEPLDVLQSIQMLVSQLAENRPCLENQYSRVVRPEGNLAGLKAMSDVFEPRRESEWRGLGSIAQSGVRIREEFSQFDAEKKFEVLSHYVPDPEGCQCSEVLTGQLKPRECQIFGTLCTPDHPIGALMVSSEGACAAYYRFSSTRVSQKESVDVES